jgi:hypothetical protein
MRPLLALAALTLAVGCDRMDPRVHASPPYNLESPPERWSASRPAPSYEDALHFLRDRRAAVEHYHQFYLSTATGSRGFAAGTAGGAALNAAFGGGIGWTTGLLAAAGGALALDSLTANGDTRAAYAAGVRGLDCVEAVAINGRRSLTASNPAVQLLDRVIDDLNGALQSNAIRNTSEALRIRGHAALGALQHLRNDPRTLSIYSDDELGVLITQNTTRVLREMNARIEGLMPDIRQVIAVAGGIAGLAQPGSASPATPAPSVAASVRSAVAATPSASVATDGPSQSLNEKTAQAVNAAVELDRRRNEERTAVRNEMASCGTVVLPTPAPLTLLENYTQDVQVGSTLTLNVQGGSGFYMIQQTGAIAVALPPEPNVGPGPFRIQIPDRRADYRGRSYTYAITDLRNPALPALPLTINVAK